MDPNTRSTFSYVKAGYNIHSVAYAPLALAFETPDWPRLLELAASAPFLFLVTASGLIPASHVSPGTTALGFFPQFIFFKIKFFCEIQFTTS